MVVWRGVQGGGVGCFFQICNRTHSDRLPVVDSLQCWRMVYCKLVMSFIPFHTEAELLEENWILSFSE